MKILTIEGEAKFRKELKANLENCGISYDIHILTIWYDEKTHKDYHGVPTSSFDDNGDRVMIKESIELALSETKAVYLDVTFDSVSIWKANNDEEHFDFVTEVTHHGRSI